MFNKLYKYKTCIDKINGKKIKNKDLHNPDNKNNYYFV